MTLENVMKEIRKQFGEMSILKLGDSAQRDVEAVSTGALGLDLALGVGGLPKGRIIELYGHESSGKTTLALHPEVTCTSRGKPGFPASTRERPRETFFSTSRGQIPLP